MSTNLTFLLTLGGHFGAEYDGQFAPELGGQFAAEFGDHFERILHFMPQLIIRVYGNMIITFSILHGHR